MGNKELTFTFCCRKSLAERLEAQEDLNIKGEYGKQRNYFHFLLQEISSGATGSTRRSQH